MIVVGRVGLVLIGLGVGSDMMGVWWGEKSFFFFLGLEVRNLYKVFYCLELWLKDKEKVKESLKGCVGLVFLLWCWF